MKIKDFLRAHTGVARGELEIFLCKVLDISRTEVVLQEDRNLSNSEIAALDKMVNDRKAGKPAAYILNEKEFYGRMFYVDENVLIPRPETETIIDIVCEIVKQNFCDKKVRVVDVGTGSSCIATTLKCELGDGAEITATDKSLEALEVAKRNAERHNAAIQFNESDLLGSVNGDFDIIVANLPYVDSNWDWLDKNALSFEPKKALYADDEGLVLIYQLIKQAAKRTEFIVLEADPCQHGKIIEYAKKYGLECLKTDGFIIALRVLRV